MRSNPVRENWPTDSATSARMRVVRQTSTAPERRAQDALRDIGVRFSVGLRSIAGTPDLCSKKFRWAIFVHGCFWHGYSNCPHATMPSRNRAAWLAKIKGNKARDHLVMRVLKKQGYATLVLWECQTHDPKRVRKRLVSFFSSKVQGVTCR